MKHHFFQKALSLFALVFVFVACSKKEDHVTSVNPEERTHQISSALDQNNLEILECIWIDFGGPIPEKSCDCFSSNGNCFPEVVVTPAQNNAHGQFNTAVDRGVTHTFFADPMALELFPYLEGTTQHEVLKRQDVVVIRPPSAESEKGMVYYHAVHLTDKRANENEFRCDRYQVNSDEYKACAEEAFMKMYDNDQVMMTIQLNPSGV